MKISDYIFKNTDIDLYSSEWEKIDKLPLMVKPQLTGYEKSIINKAKSEVKNISVQYNYHTLKGLTELLINIIEDRLTNEKE